ncbi:hypothetical protein [Staphylococcus gallinarum]|uniref:Uncharacterized protein n=1 Tax=Staphylococcus gallinarum TaxID=1293 RepID=A0A418HK76_STAGA|nr:hypothetical protein [Staphylococcus gallinarum]MCD8827224.1 hypothetical protein [Staphylococcus gallinarum]RIL40976.1 hypothetical protein BUZ01_13835 [Staphylococcus gallinarum]RIO92893.1 hypothetical protein BUZ04_05890 [Staphylococcus gallinarum]
MPDITSFIVIFLLCGLQYIISRLKFGILGAVVPIIYIISMFYTYSMGKINNITVFIVLLLAGIAFLSAEWIHGRQDRKKKHADELDKMKKQEL